MKKIIKYFSLVLFSAFFMFLIVSDPVSAVYDREKNNTYVSISKEQIKITVKYQRGFYKNYATYQWCKDINETTGECTEYYKKSGSGVPYTVNYVEAGGDPNLSYIAGGNASHVDKNLTTYTFTVKPYSTDNYKGDEVLANLDTFAGETLRLELDVYYCSVRNEVDGDYPSCLASDNHHPNKKIKVTVSVNDLLNDKDYVNKEIEDEGIKSLMTKVEEIVNGTVMPIIWVVLGLFLVVKGTLLGFQIVKAADEPQVRQEKVGALKWLVIGVAIAYASSFVVGTIVGFFENVFK